MPDTYTSLVVCCPFVACLSTGMLSYVMQKCEPISWKCMGCEKAQGMYVFVFQAMGLRADYWPAKVKTKAKNLI